MPMSDSRVDFKRFHHVTIAVPDLERAAADWTERLGWQPSATSTDHARFPLGDAYVDLIDAGEAGLAPGVALVSVVVDDVAEVTARLEEADVSLSKSADGGTLVDPSAVTGVPLELRSEEVAAAASHAMHPSGPYRRINHVVVAVADDDAALNSWAGLFGAWPAHATNGEEVAHHVPVGIAWFGLTSGGTDPTALARFVERRGEGVYALGIVVDDHLGTIKALAQRGARILGSAGQGQTFLHPSTTHGILIDLVPERHLSRLR
jgi:methylmalonyl-CoA/ethylmalonyl-CoA epimerase